MLSPVTSMVAPGAADWSRQVAAPSPAMSDAGLASQTGEADRQAFASLMQSPSQQNVARLDPGHRGAVPSMIEQFAATQNADMRELLQSTRDLIKAAPHLSMSEMMAFGNEITMNIAVTTTQFNAAGNFGKSASKGVETLMRNQ